MPGLAQRGALAALLLPLCSAHGPKPARLREALLHEAQERLTTWYEDKDSLDLPFWRDGAQVQMSKGECLCDAPGKDDKVPLTFGQFEVEDARPVDIFNVLSDNDNQMSWDPTVSQVKEIKGDWPREDGVRAMEMKYPTGVFLVPDREVFEWVAYKADFEKQEFWVVYSTVDTSRLQQVLAPDSDAVPAQNCLGAYWIRPGAHGEGAHVLFTQHVNAHPPLMLSAKFVFQVSWGKQVDYIDILRKQAQKQTKLGWASNRTVVGKELLKEQSWKHRPEKADAADWVGDMKGSVFAKIDSTFYRLWEDARPHSASNGAAKIHTWSELSTMTSVLSGAGLFLTAAALVMRRQCGRRAAVLCPATSARKAACPSPAPEEATLLQEPTEGSIA